MGRILLIIIVIVGLMLAMVAVRISRMPDTPLSEDSQHLTIGIPQGYSYGQSNFGRQLDISPDGKKVVYVGRGAGENRKLFVQTIGEPTPEAIAGSDGANDPSFSPDGLNIVFYAYPNVKKLTLDSGEIKVMGRAPAPRGTA